MTGGQQGPVDEAGLKAAFIAKQLVPASVVWNENMDEWTPLGKVPGLQARLTPAPVAPARPPTAGGPPVGPPLGPPVGVGPPVAASPPLGISGTTVSHWQAIVDCELLSFVFMMHD